MTDTIAAVMRHVRNYFVRKRIEGEITVTGGVVSPRVSAPYVYIAGSDTLDGVHAVQDSTIATERSETFDGMLWLLYPPGDFLALCREIEQYIAACPVNGLQSETLNEYSYTRASGASGHGVMTWEEAFSSRLLPYRRMFSEVG